MISVGSIQLIISTLLQAQRSRGDCDPNIPSRPVPLPPNFNVDVHGMKPTVCGEGEYLDWFECKPCEDGTFMRSMKSQQGKYVYCEKCYEREMYEIVDVPCIKTRDATIMCEDGYYRSAVPGKPCQSECRRCDVCGVGINMFKNYEHIECGGYQNIVCTNGMYTSVMKVENVHLAPTNSILIIDSDVNETDNSGHRKYYSNNSTYYSFYNVPPLSFVLLNVLLSKV